MLSAIPGGLFNRQKTFSGSLPALRLAVLDAAGLLAALLAVVALVALRLEDLLACAPSATYTASDLPPVPPRFLNSHAMYRRCCFESRGNVLRTSTGPITCALRAAKNAGATARLLVREPAACEELLQEFLEVLSEEKQEKDGSTSTPLAPRRTSGCTRKKGPPVVKYA